MTPAPATSGPLGDELYDQVAPLATLDPLYGYALLHLVSAFIGPAEEVDAIARDSEDGPGWSAAVDIDRCPAWALGWLGQFVGVRLLPRRADETLEEWAASMRDRITRADGRWRGGPDAIVASVQRTLTGTRLVQLVERYGGDAYALLVRTLESETASPGASLRAALEQKPAGIVLAYEQIADLPTYANLLLVVPTYGDVLDRYYDYDDLRSRVSLGPLIAFNDLPARYATYDDLALTEVSYRAVRSLH